jgi:hypothetical protein
MHGDERHWHAADGSVILFSEVMGLLECRAEELNATHEGFEEVRVMSIDFRDPRDA